MEWRFPHTSSRREKNRQSISHGEVKAEEIIQIPLLWKIRESGGLNPFCCEIRKKRAKRLRIIQRGKAIYVDGCPRAARVWRGKPYANVIDDCTHCNSYCGIEKKERFDPKTKEWINEKISFIVILPAVDSGVNLKRPYGLLSNALSQK
mgnify:CR=1 FL=1